MRPLWPYIIYNVLLIECFIDLPSLLHVQSIYRLPTADYPRVFMY